MKNFKTSLVFSAIALGAFMLPTGCVVAPQPAAQKVDYNFKLLKAAHDKDLATVKDCVKRGANVNVKDPSDWSAAMWAVWHWYDDKPLCAYIMHSGGGFAQPQRDNLLERAARTGDVERAAFFLDLGANPNYVNAFGENCATLALRYFRGQYGIKENAAALPRYENLNDVVGAMKLNAEELAAAKEKLAEAEKALTDYAERSKRFDASPQKSPDARERFDEKELADAREFFKKKKNAVAPETLRTAAQVYGALVVEAAAGRDAAAKTLQYARFIELLKNRGADLRKLLAGTQDNSGKQDKWKGQQDKWTADPVARYGVSHAQPVLTEGLWDGELALIQLIGRGDEIFREQIKDTFTPVTQEYLCALYLSENEKALALVGAIVAMIEAGVLNEMQARTIMTEIYGSIDNRPWSVQIKTMIRPELSPAELLVAARRGAVIGAEVGRLLGAIEFVEKGSRHLDLINSAVNKANAKTRERNEKIFSLFEEFPLEGELATEWKAAWKRKLDRREKFAEMLRNELRSRLEAEVVRRERKIVLMYKWGETQTGDPLDIADNFSQLEDEMDEKEKELEKIKKFLASDFFKKKSVAELAENPPNPRDEDPIWYAKHCLGKLKSPQVFLDIAKEFLDYGVDVNGRANVTDNTALLCALLWERPEFVKLLDDYGADKKLSLFHVCKRGDFDLLKKLLENFAVDVSDVPADAAGNEILHRAVLAKRADVVELLVKNGANVNGKNKHDDTPLHLAAELEDEACVRALLACGADVNAKDKDDRKPFQRFWNLPRPELTQLFVEAHREKK